MAVNQHRVHSPPFAIVGVKYLLYSSLEAYADRVLSLRFAPRSLFLGTWWVPGGRLKKQADHENQTHQLLYPHSQAAATLLGRIARFAIPILIGIRRHFFT
jgi:hypothetical protein